MSIQTMRFVLRQAASWPARGKIHHVDLRMLDIRYDEQGVSLWVDCWLERTLQIRMPDGRLKYIHDQINLQGKTENRYGTFPRTAQAVLENLVYTPRSSQENTEVEMEVHLVLDFPQNKIDDSLNTPPHQDVLVWVPCRIRDGLIQNVILWEFEETPANRPNITDFRIEGEFYQWEHGGIYSGHLYWQPNPSKEERTHPFTIVISTLSSAEDAVYGGVSRLINIEPIDREHGGAGFAFLVEVSWWLTVPRELLLSVAMSAPEKDGIRLKQIVERKELEITQTVILPDDVLLDQDVELTCSLGEHASRRSDHGLLFYGDWIISIYYSGADGQEHHSEMSVPWHWWWETGAEENGSKLELDYGPIKAEIKDHQVLLHMKAVLIRFEAGLFALIPSNQDEQETIAAQKMVSEMSISFVETVESLPELAMEAMLSVRWKAEIQKSKVYNGWISVTTCLYGEVDYRDKAGKVLSLPIQRVFYHALNNPVARRGHAVQTSLNLQYQGIAEKTPHGRGFLLLFQYNYSLWKEDFIPVSVRSGKTYEESSLMKDEGLCTSVIVWEETLPTGGRNVLSAKFWLSQCREELRASGRFVEGELHVLVEWEDSEGYVRRSDFNHPFWCCWEEVHDLFGMTVLTGGDCSIAPRWAWGAGRIKLTAMLHWVRLPEGLKEEWGIGCPHLIRRRGSTIASVDPGDTQDFIDCRQTNYVGTYHRMANAVPPQDRSLMPREKS